jgi:hypothetical protein
MDSHLLKQVGGGSPRRIPVSDREGEVFAFDIKEATWLAIYEPPNDVVYILALLAYVRRQDAFVVVEQDLDPYAANDRHGWLLRGRDEADGWLARRNLTPAVPLDKLGPGHGTGASPGLNLSLSPNDWPVLRKLATMPELIWITDLAAEMNRERTGLGEQLRHLERLGLVAFPRGTRSGVAITPLGRQVLTRAQQGTT